MESLMRLPSMQRPQQVSLKKGDDEPVDLVRAIKVRAVPGPADKWRSVGGSESRRELTHDAIVTRVTSSFRCSRVLSVGPPRSSASPLSAPDTSRQIRCQSRAKATPAPSRVVHGHGTSDIAFGWSLPTSGKPSGDALARVAVRESRDELRDARVWQQSSNDRIEAFL